MKLAYCLVSVSPVRSEERDSSEIVTQLLFGEIVTVEEITSPWCKIVTYSDHYPGFVDVKHLRFLSQKEVNRWMDGIGFQTALLQKTQTPWGDQLTYRGSYMPIGQLDEFQIGNDSFQVKERIDNTHFTSPSHAASFYLNTPYLWGGKSPFGIDCSGLTQMIFRFFDINLPRDASQQVECGSYVDFDDRAENDLAFFANKDGKVTHVGVLCNDGSIIHAAGCVRKDILTAEGIVHCETQSITHKLSEIRRM
ncbi:MAG: NlpC/P60 family protein [Flavobacteriia bacterium]|nr:C40 family peptidase [Cryomorphaceae bacterium]